MTLLTKVSHGELGTIGGFVATVDRSGDGGEAVQNL